MTCFLQKRKNKSSYGFLFKIFLIKAIFHDNLFMIFIIKQTISIDLFLSYSSLVKQYTYADGCVNDSSGGKYSFQSDIFHL